MNNAIDINSNTTEANWVEHFVNNFNSLNAQNLNNLQDIYHNDIVFTDPVHRIEGYDELLSYFSHLYQNLIHSHFDVHHKIVQANEAAIYWTMELSHQRLNKGQPFSVEGHSHIKHKNGLIIYHRDYFDFGQMVYEQLPLVGSLVKLIKSRVAK